MKFVKKCMIVLSLFAVALTCWHYVHAQAAQPTLVGTWYLQSFNNKYFNSGEIIVLTFHSDGKYALTTYVTLINGNMGSEYELGTFRREGKRTIRFVPASSTCAKRERKQYTINYTLAMTSLVLHNVHENRVFRRNIVFDEAVIVKQLDTSLVPPLQGCYDVEHRRFTFLE